MWRRLQILLYIIAVYLAVISIFFLFLPAAFEKIMAITLPDKGMNMLNGQMTLTFAYVAFLTARSGEGLSKLFSVLLVFIVGHVIIFGYQLATDMNKFPPYGLIIFTLFSVLLILFRKDINK